jgi:hypothetical protein
MNDDEARYLIGQCNSYVSWTERRYEVGATVFVFILAISALNLSLINLDPTMSSFFFLRLWKFEILHWAIWGSATFAAVLFCVFYAFINRAYTGHERWLLALEKYRFKHKSLPDSISLRLIIKEPEEAEKRLEQSESSLRASPQT